MERNLEDSKIKRAAELGITPEAMVEKFGSRSVFQRKSQWRLSGATTDREISIWLGELAEKKAAAEAATVTPMATDRQISYIIALANENGTLRVPDLCDVRGEIDSRLVAKLTRREASSTITALKEGY